MGQTNYAVRGRTAVITLDHPPVNALSYDVRRGIVDGLDAAQGDPNVSAVVLIGNAKGFSAGADINEIGRDSGRREPTLTNVIRAIETCEKPVVGAIHGTTSGGGLELALACHYRVALPSATVALPEVKIGLIPGAGGTQRLPRVVGVERALQMITTGGAVSAQELAHSKLFDALVEGDLLEQSVAFAEKIVASGSERPLLRNLKVEFPEADGLLQVARTLASFSPQPSSARLRAIDAIQAAVKKGFDEGLVVERESFVVLQASPQSRALRHGFISERAAPKIADLDQHVLARAIEKVAIVGAGAMGAGIAISCLNAGIPVTLLDTSSASLTAGVARIESVYEAACRKGKLSESTPSARLALLFTTLEYAGIGDADLVIEAVFEDMEVKQKVFQQLDTVMKRKAILATNTSTLDVDRIASLTARPEDVIGLHFFSPAHVMRLLEVVRGRATSQEVLATAMQLARRLGKTAVVSGVCDGFIGNRILQHYMRAASFLVEEGASPQQVDRALEKWGMAMGPFRTLDLAGLDVSCAVRRRRYIECPDLVFAKFADRLCELGRYGQKTGKGWYLYPDGPRTAVPDPVVQTMLADYRVELGISPRNITDDEIVERCIFALVNEGARVLEEGIAQRASDIDVVFLAGYGFPPERGGPLFYADEVGLHNVARALRRFAKITGDGFWEPASSIARLIDSGGSFN